MHREDFGYTPQLCKTHNLSLLAYSSDLLALPLQQLVISAPGFHHVATPTPTSVCLTSFLTTVLTMLTSEWMNPPTYLPWYNPMHHSWSVWSQWWEHLHTPLTATNPFTVTPFHIQLLMPYPLLISQGGFAVPQPPILFPQAQLVLPTHIIENAPPFQSEISSHSLQ